MDVKRIAVLVSSCNGEVFIAKQIESVVKQNTMHKIDIYVRDDGSCDYTPDILLGLTKVYPSLSVILGENIGLTASSFSLLNQVSGYDYYAFCDQDDYWLSDKIETAVEYLENQSEKDIPLLYGCPSFICDEELNQTGKTTQIKRREISFYNTAIQNFAPGHNQVLNNALRDAIIKNTLIKPALEEDIRVGNGSDDEKKTLKNEVKNLKLTDAIIEEVTKDIYSQDLWVTNVAAVTGKIVYDNNPHTLYRMHKGNKMGFGTNAAQWAKERMERINKGNEGKRFSKQLHYFCRLYKNELTVNELNEAKNYLAAKDSFLKRFSYIKHSDLYRQKEFETFLFKVLYLMGKY